MSNCYLTKRCGFGEYLKAFPMKAFTLDIENLFTHKKHKHMCIMLIQAIKAKGKGSRKVPINKILTRLRQGKSFSISNQLKKIAKEFTQTSLIIKVSGKFPTIHGLCKFLINCGMLWLGIDI